jgi:hypothetical protein
MADIAGMLPSGKSARKAIWSLRASEAKLPGESRSDIPELASKDWLN